MSFYQVGLNTCSLSLPPLTPPRDPALGQETDKRREVVVVLVVVVVAEAVLIVSWGVKWC